MFLRIVLSYQGNMAPQSQEGQIPDDHEQFFQAYLGPLAAVFGGNFGFGEAEYTLDDLYHGQELQIGRKNVLAEDIARLLLEEKRRGPSPELTRKIEAARGVELMSGSELPFGLAAVVIEDDDDLRERYVGILTDELTQTTLSEASATYSEGRLFGVREPLVLGFSGLYGALEYFQDNDLSDVAVALMLDLNLEGEDQDDILIYARSCATREVENYGRLRRLGRLIKDEDVWQEEQIQKLMPKYTNLFGKLAGIRAVEELRAVGANLMSVSINSGEDQSVLQEASWDLREAVESGHFPLPTRNAKTPEDPDLDPMNVADHILYVGAQVLEALNDPECVEAWRNKEELAKDYGVGLANLMRQKVGATYRPLVGLHQRAKFNLARVLRLRDQELRQGSGSGAGEFIDL